jgi:HECT-like Ubiquitin-conjugating enzyme (E2)-binding/MYND finger
MVLYVAKHKTLATTTTMTTLCLPSSSQHDQPQQPPSYCQVCHQACRPLRCTGCQSAWYCSTDCQKVDWKSNDHRKTCAGQRRPRGLDVIRSTNQTNEITTATTTTSGQALQATLQELRSLALGLSLNQAQEEYHKAQDEVKRQVVELNSNTESKEGVRNSRSIFTTAMKTKSKVICGNEIAANPADLKREELSDNSGNENSPTKQRNENKRQDTRSSGTEIDPIDTSIMASNDYFSYVMVEDMSRIARYQVTLKQRQLLPPQDQGNASRKSGSIRAIDSIDNLNVSTQVINDKPYQNNTLVMIRSKTNPEAHISIQLPRRLITMSSPSLSSSSSYQNHPQATMDDDGTIQLRLHYQHSGSINHNDDDDDDLRMSDVLYEDCPPTFSQQLLPITAKIINSLQCRFCGLSLLPQGSVDRVLPLPTGYWDEVADYLICYSGVS